jgi:hypothetical protein
LFPVQPHAAGPSEESASVENKTIYEYTSDYGPVRAIAVSETEVVFVIGNEKGIGEWFGKGDFGGATESGFSVTCISDYSILGEPGHCEIKAPS